MAQSLQRVYFPALEGDVLDVLPAAIAAAGILTGPAHRIDEHYRGDGPDGDKTSADNRAGTVSDFIPCPP